MSAAMRHAQKLMVPKGMWSRSAVTTSRRLKGESADTRRGPQSRLARELVTRLPTGLRRDLIQKLSETKEEGRTVRQELHKYLVKPKKQQHVADVLRALDQFLEHGNCDVEAHTSADGKKKGAGRRTKVEVRHNHRQPFQLQLQRMVALHEQDLTLEFERLLAQLSRDKPPVENVKLETEVVAPSAGSKGHKFSTAAEGIALLPSNECLNGHQHHTQLSGTSSTEACELNGASSHQGGSKETPGNPLTRRSRQIRSASHGEHAVEVEDKEEEEDEEDEEFDDQGDLSSTNLGQHIKKRKPPRSFMAVQAMSHEELEALFQQQPQVFVDPLPESASAQEIMEIFSHLGQVSSVLLLETCKTKERAALVEFATFDGFKTCLAADVRIFGVCWRRVAMKPKVPRPHCRFEVLRDLGFYLVVDKAGDVAQGPPSPAEDWPQHMVVNRAARY